MKTYTNIYTIRQSSSVRQHFFWQLMVYICSTHANQVVEVLAPIFAVYENVRGATQRMKDSKTKKVKDAPVPGWIRDQQVFNTNDMFVNLYFFT